MLERASREIDRQLRSWLLESRQRSARRRKVQHIDRLLEQLESLNLSDVAVIPPDLLAELRVVFYDYRLPGAVEVEVSPLVQETMERLYDLQNGLLIEGRVGFVEAEEFLVDTTVRRPGRKPRWT
jgi:hypothetical protein